MFAAVTCLAFGPNQLILMTCRLNLAEAKLLSQPPITGTGYWAPAKTEITSFVVCSIVKGEHTGATTIISGGDGTVFDTSALIRIKFNLTPTMKEQYMANLKWGGLPKHIFENVGGFLSHLRKLSIS